MWICYIPARSPPVDFWCPHEMAGFLGHDFLLAINSTVTFKALHGLTWAALSIALSPWILHTSNTGCFRSTPCCMYSHVWAFAHALSSLEDSSFLLSFPPTPLHSTPLNSLLVTCEVSSSVSLLPGSIAGSIVYLYNYLYSTRGRGHLFCSLHLSLPSSWHVVANQYMFVEWKIVLLGKEAIEGIPGLGPFHLWDQTSDKTHPFLPLNNMLSCATGISDVHFLLQTEIHSRLWCKRQQESPQGSCMNST